MLKTNYQPQSGQWWAYPKGRQRIRYVGHLRAGLQSFLAFMVTLTENKLIIELESSYPAALLRDLQESLLDVLKHHCAAASTEAHQIDTSNCMELLRALLPSTEDYERFGISKN